MSRIVKYKDNDAVNLDFCQMIRKDREFLDREECFIEFHLGMKRGPIIWYFDTEEDREKIYDILICPHITYIKDVNELITVRKK